MARFVPNLLERIFYLDPMDKAHAGLIIVISCRELWIAVPGLRQLHRIDATALCENTEMKFYTSHWYWHIDEATEYLLNITSAEAEVGALLMEWVHAWRMIKSMRD